MSIPSCSTMLNSLFQDIEPPVSQDAGLPASQGTSQDPEPSAFQDPELTVSHDSEALASQDMPKDAEPSVSQNAASPVSRDMSLDPEPSMSNNYPSGGSASISAMELEIDEPASSLTVEELAVLFGLAKSCPSNNEMSPISSISDDEVCLSKLIIRSTCLY